jgi:RNA polymerase sigma-70 factor (ECF subfamily)
LKRKSAAAQAIEQRSSFCAEGQNGMSIHRDNGARLEREERWRELMRAAQDGDNAAYAALLSEILPVLRRSVAYRWPNAPDVEDIVQEVLLSVHTVRHTYDPARPFMPWLMTIAIRRTIDAARRRTARSANETTVDVLPEAFSGEPAKNEQETSDDQEVIRRALAQLPDGQREAVELMKVQGLSLQEASAVTGKSVASLKVSVHRALKAMCEVLKKES